MTKTTRIYCFALLVLALACVIVRGGPLDPPKADPAEVKVPPAAPVVVVAPPGVATGAEVQKAADDTKKAVEDAKKTPPPEDYVNNVLKAIATFLSLLLANYLQSHWRGVFGSKVVQDAAAQILPHIGRIESSMSPADMDILVTCVTNNVIKAMKEQP